MKLILITILIVCLVIILTAFVALFVITLKIHDSAFNIRYDQIPVLKYFSYKDFPNLKVKMKYMVCRKAKGNDWLVGYLYYQEENYSEDKVIIFCHGLGPGQSAYATEIATLASTGYPVFALDSLGCNYSDGKGMRGIYEYTIAVMHAIDKIKDEYPNSKIVLVGHSLGGYSALCATKKFDVEKVVAISAPASPVKTATHLLAGQTSKAFARLVTPFFWLVNFFRFGIAGNTNAAKCAKKCKSQILLIHGGKDNIIAKNNAVYYLCEGKNIKKLFREESGHNPYNTVNAEKRLAVLTQKLAEQDAKFFETFDFVEATEEEPFVFDEIKKFIKS
jgi:hypothetical protein